METKFLTRIAEKLHSRSLQSLFGVSQQHNCLMIVGISPNFQDVVSGKQKYSTALFCGESAMQTYSHSNTYAALEMQVKQCFSSNILVLLREFLTASS